MGDMSIYDPPAVVIPACRECGEPSAAPNPPLCQVHLDERQAKWSERNEQWEAEQKEARRIRHEELRQQHAEAEVENLTAWNRYCEAELTDPRLKKWVDNLIDGTAEKRSVLLWGGLGIGKTHTMYAIGLELIRRRYLITQSCSVQMYRRESVVRLLASLRPGGGLETLDEVIATPVLLLDDLGVEKGTEWTKERLYELINERYEADAVTIISTNKTPQEMPEATSPRVASRLYEMCLSVPLKGQDRRIQRKARA